MLIISVRGGIGIALLQLGRVEGLKMFVLASQSKHTTLAEYVAIPIDYHTEDFVTVTRRMKLAGLDAVFDGIGGDYLPRGLSLLKHGSVWVSYANPRSLSSMVHLLGRVLWHNLLPDGCKVVLYGTGASNLDRYPFLKDCAALFDLLGAGRIKPIIATRFPLLEAARSTPCWKAVRSPVIWFCWRQN